MFDCKVTKVLKFKPLIWGKWIDIFYIIGGTFTKISLSLKSLLNKCCWSFLLCTLCSFEVVQSFNNVSMSKIWLHVFVSLHSVSFTLDCQYVLGYKHMRDIEVFLLIRSRVQSLIVSVVHDTSSQMLWPNTGRKSCHNNCLHLWTSCIIVVFRGGPSLFGALTQP